MAAVDRKSLLALFGTRFDSYSAQVVLDEALEKAHLLGKDPLNTADLALLAPLLPNLRTRMQHIAAEVERLAGGAAPAAAAAHVSAAPSAAGHPPPAPTVVPPAPAPAPAALAQEPTAAGLPEIPAGAAKEAAVAGRGPFRITASEAGTVRWGTNGWRAPPAASLPEGTTKVANEPTVDSELIASGGEFALVLGPFEGAVNQIDFTVRYQGNRWAPPCAIRLGAA